MRLDKCIADHSSYSRSEVRRLLRDGVVTVNGLVCTDPARALDPDADVLTLAGAPLATATVRCYMMNKPAGVLSATRDGRTPTVLSLLPPALRKGIFPAGRLDADSTGFVLLTNDGALAHRILAPKSHIPKYYFVQLAEPLSSATAPAFAAGVTLEDGTLCRPARVSGTAGGERTALVELTEGKFHQVKRMFQTVENEVVHLHRIQLGDLPIDVKLGAGAYLLLLNKDIVKLLKTPDFSRVQDFCDRHFCSEWINY